MKITKSVKKNSHLVPNVYNSFVRVQPANNPKRTETTVCCDGYDAVTFCASKADLGFVMSLKEALIRTLQEERERTRAEGFKGGENLARQKLSMNLVKASFWTRLKYLITSMPDDFI